MRFAILAAAGLIATAPADGSAPAPDWYGAQTIAVRLSNFSFAPAEIELRRGTAYRLHLVNAASGGHDFAAARFFAASEIALQDRARIDGGRVELDGGQSADIRLVPLTAGTYRLHCSHFMHTTFGMKGTIIVR
jgi:uncharacterized cupredoxin-like copper-binding protein